MVPERFRGQGQDPNCKGDAKEIIMGRGMGGAPSTGTRAGHCKKRELTK